MATAHQKYGATALLFDRLIPRRTGNDAAAVAARQVYDIAELQASIAEQLGWLLNTRVPIDYETLDARTRAGVRSTVDYGLPDLTVYPVGDHAAMVRLIDHLSHTIALYEPRLLRPRIAIVSRDGRGDTLIAQIDGDVRIGLVVTPVTFTVPIRLKGETDGG